MAPQMTVGKRSKPTATTHPRAVNDEQRVKDFPKDKTAGKDNCSVP
jgi:hypothetical protein